MTTILILCDLVLTRWTQHFSDIPVSPRQFMWYLRKSLQWRYNERDGVSNHQRLDCLLNRCSGADQRKHQSSSLLAFVRGIDRWPVNSPHKGPETRKMFPFDDVIEYVRMPKSTKTSRGLMQGINMEKSSQGCYKAIQICFCDSYHNKIIDIQNRLPYSKVVYPAIIVLFFMSNGSKSWCWKPLKLSFQINQIAFWSSPLIHTVALKGHHCRGFSLHYINFDLCEKNIMWLCIHNYLACIHNYLACIHNHLECLHNYLYMYT